MLKIIFANAYYQGRQMRGPMQDLGAGPNARPRRGASLSSNLLTPSCSANRVTIVVERRYAVQILLGGHFEKAAISGWP